MKLASDIIKRPIISEKTIALAEERKYTFEVSKGVNKVEIKKAIEEIFNVRVTKVNTITGPLKKKRVGKHQGFKARVRKAVITLAEGQKIKLFEV